MVEMDADATAAQVAAVLDRARHVLVITGAGLSAESGLPTYRGVGGLYDTTDTDDGMAIEDALSGAQFARNPAVTWKYLWQIGQACRGAVPNEAHCRLAGWQRDDRRVTVLTQNIDGFHSAAGSTEVIEMHGNMSRLVCTVCPWTGDADAVDAAKLPPQCPDCGAVVRPDVILFGEMLPDAAVRAYDAVMGAEPELVLSVGTTSVFPYIAAPVQWAAHWGGTTVEINPGETVVSNVVDHRFACGAVAALRRIDAALPG